MAYIQGSHAAVSLFVIRRIFCEPFCLQHFCEPVCCTSPRLLLSQLYLTAPVTVCLVGALLLPCVWLESPQLFGWGAVGVERLREEYAHQMWVGSVC
jgi:hypothetical protein